MIAGKFLRNLCGLLVVWAVACAPQARAATLWYNGDQDGRDAWSNQTATSATGVDSVVYDDFIVPAGQKWTITSVWSNDVKNPFFSFSNPTSVSWQIHSGMSVGVAGTTVASGTATSTNVTVASDGTSVVFAPFSSTQYTITAKGMSVVLNPGTYWLAVTPVTTGAVDSYWYDSTTSGTNAVGTPAGNDDNSFVYSVADSYNYASLSTLEGGGTWDYSMGVAGTFVLTPEPPSMVLLLAASLSLPGLGFTRRLKARLLKRQ